jgi:hypothetical protein
MHRVRLEAYFTIACFDHREKERRASGLETKLPACRVFAKQLKPGPRGSPEKYTNFESRPQMFARGGPGTPPPPAKGHRCARLGLGRGFHGVGRRHAAQKAVHPALGAMLVAPAAYTHPLLASFTHVETLRSRGHDRHFQDHIGRTVRKVPPMAVYIDRPAQSTAISVASTLGNDLLFNLPCTISGGTGVVSFATSTLIDTGCSTISLISKRAAARLSLVIQPCHEQLVMADGSNATCEGQVSVRIKMQRHTFPVRAFVVDMNDSFDLILGQQWLHDHKAIIDFRRESITLAKGRTACTLNAPSKYPLHQPPPSAKRKRTSSKPISVSAVAKHLRRGGKVYEFAVHQTSKPTVSDNDSQPSTSTPAPSEHAERISRLMSKYGDVFRDELPPGQHGPQAPELVTQEPGTQPVYTPAYRASPREREEMLRQVNEGIALGHVRVSKSPYGSSVLFVAKSDGSLRMCIDYRRLRIRLPSSSATPCRALLMSLTSLGTPKSSH